MERTASKSGLDELVERLKRDEPRRRERIARGRAHFERALRYCGYTEEELARRRAEWWAQVEDL